jgi:hemoglobin-like flavoprotein
MILTTTEIELVQRSWAVILPRARQTARLFYARLFETHPELKPLFHSDMQEQGRKLMAMLNLAVASLGRLEPLLATIRESGKRHAAYGVTDEDYEKVAQALLWTLEQGLGEAFTPEVRKAWAAVYGTVAEAMKAGAAEQPAA